MADYQRSNQNTNRAVNTSGLTAKNGKSSDHPSALTVSYWDDRVRLAFSPELPLDQQTEMRRYDYDHSVLTTLGREKCNEMFNAYKEVIRPAIMEGKQAAISLPIAGVNQLQINTGVEGSEDGAPRPFIALIKGIDPNSLTASEDKIVRYEFCQGEYILDYNPATGKFSDRVITYNELDLFMNDLNAFREAGSNAYIHTDRVINKYWKDTLDSKLNRIGEKNGLDLTYKPRFGTGGNGGQGVIFEKPSGKTTPPEGQETVGSIDDIDGLFAGLN